MANQNMVIRIKHNNEIVRSIEIPMSELGPHTRANESWILDVAIIKREDRLVNVPLMPWGDNF